VVSALISLLTRPDRQSERLDIHVSSLLSHLDPLGIPERLQTPLADSLWDNLNSIVSRSEVEQGLESLEYMCQALEAHGISPEQDSVDSGRIELLNVVLSMEGATPVVHSTCLYMIYTAIGILKSGFERYLPMFKPKILLAVQSPHRELCRSGVLCMQELAGELGDTFELYANEFIGTITSALQNPQISDVTLYPELIAAIADAVLSIQCTTLIRQLPLILEMIESFSLKIVQRQLAVDTYIFNDYCEAIIDAYTSTVQCIGDQYQAIVTAGISDKLDSQVQIIFDMMRVCIEQPNVSTRAQQSVCGLIGDLCTMYSGVGIMRSALEQNKTCISRILTVIEQEDSRQLAAYCRRAVAGHGISV